MKEKIINFIKFFGKTTDILIFKKLGKDVYIRNGVGYGFISEEFLYDNRFLELGIGRITSGYGDWIGGNYDVSCPLKIVIDKDYIIQRIETDSFYNSNSSKVVEEIAKRFLNKLKIGDKFYVKDKFLKECIDKIFEKLPCKYHIGFDVFRSPHMIKYFTEQEDDRFLRDIIKLK